MSLKGTCIEGLVSRDSMERDETGYFGQVLDDCMLTLKAGGGVPAPCFFSLLLDCSGEKFAPPHGACAGST